MTSPENQIKNSAQNEANIIADSLSLPDDYIRDWQEKGLEKQAESYEAVTRICRAIQDVGGRALLVGGGVRDLLLSKEVKDFDIEVFGVEAEKLEDILRPFGKVMTVGKSFGVLKVSINRTIDIDVSLPRRDSKTGSRHGDFSVATDPFMAISEAARRRDFTINAILADPLTGKIIDPFHGVDDLKSKTLRVVDEGTFVDDPLRVLRAMQFVGRFDLEIDAESKKLMSGMVDSLQHLSKERVYEEWRKLLLKAQKPSRGLQAGMEMGVFEKLHPEFVPLTTTAQDPEKHPEGNVWEHTLIVVDEMADIARREKLTEQEMWSLMLAALCHDLGKSTTTKEKDGKIIAHGHELASVGLSKSFLDSISDDNFTRTHVLPLVQNHMRPMHLYNDRRQNNEIKDSVFRRLAKDLAPANIRELALLSEADKKSTGLKSAQQIKESIDWLISRAEQVGVDRQVAAELMKGKDFLDLGFTPGPEIGRLIQLASQLRDVRGFSREDIIQNLSSSKTSIGAMEVLEKLLRQD